MLLAKFAEQCQAQGAALAANLTSDARTRDEAAWSEAVQQRWNPLPPLSRVSVRHSVSAVDGSGGLLPLNNGFTVLVAQAVLTGAAERLLAEPTAVTLGLAHARGSQGDMSALGDLLMRRLETRLARDAIVARGYEAPEPPVVLLDRSLHGEVTHLSRWHGRTEPLAAGLLGALDRPELLTNGLDSYIDLLGKAHERRRLVLGITKTLRARFLASLLARQVPAGAVFPSDPELLYRWRSGVTGYTDPVMLGAADRSDHDLPLAVESLLADCPAIVSTYVRVSPADDPIRLDMPVSALGSGKCFLDVDAEWLQRPAAIAPFVAMVVAMYGGPTVHNTLLYKADRQVRLTRRTLEQVYLPVLSQVSGVPLAVDRSRRRFLAR